MSKVLQNNKATISLGRVKLELFEYIYKENQPVTLRQTFSFREIRETETLEIIKSLPKNKATVFKDIPMRIIKDAAHVYSHRLTIIFNNCIKNSKFPDILKYADITPVF